MNRKVIILLSILLILVGSIGTRKLLISYKEVPTKKASKELKRFIKTQTVEYAAVTSEISSSGRLQSYDEIILSSEVNGRLSKGHAEFKQGASFKKGELLAVVVNDEFTLSIKAQKSQFLQSVASILAEIKIDYPEDFELWNRYFEAISLTKDLPPLPEITNKKERIFLATRGILSNYYSIKSNEARLHKHQIVAPFTGSFKEIHQQVGGVVNNGTKLAVINRTDLYELEIPIDIDNIHLVKVGQKVNTTNQSGEQYEGTISRIAQVVSPNTQSVSVFIKIPNINQKQLKAGMYLFAHFKGSDIPNVMEIPRNAVFNGNQVYILKDSSLVKATIEVKMINENTLLFSRLNEGSEVVIEPVLNVTGKANFAKLNEE